MEVLYPKCAGLDVHKKTVVVCVRIQQGAAIEQEVRTFDTTTSGLLALSAWLSEKGCTLAAMEATGVYWKPVWHILADGEFELLLANAAHVKNVPGRKTDVNDATWLSELAAHGLIRGSFVPDRPTQELRSLLRTRKQLVRERSSRRAPLGGRNRRLIAADGRRLAAGRRRLHPSPRSRAMKHDDLPPDPSYDLLPDPSPVDLAGVDVLGPLDLITVLAPCFQFLVERMGATGVVSTQKRHGETLYSLRDAIRLGHDIEAHRARKRKIAEDARLRVRRQRHAAQLRQNLPSLERKV